MQSAMQQLCGNDAAVNLRLEEYVQVMCVCSYYSHSASVGPSVIAERGARTDVLLLLSGDAHLLRRPGDAAISIHLAKRADAKSVPCLVASEASVCVYVLLKELRGEPRVWRTRRSEGASALSAVVLVLHSGKGHRQFRVHDRCVNWCAQSHGIQVHRVRCRARGGSCTCVGRHRRADAYGHRDSCVECGNTRCAQHFTRALIQSSQEEVLQCLCVGARYRQQQAAECADLIINRGASLRQCEELRSCCLSRGHRLEAGSQPCLKEV